MMKNKEKRQITIGVVSEIYDIMTIDLAEDISYEDATRIITEKLKGSKDDWKYKMNFDGILDEKGIIGELGTISMCHGIPSTTSVDINVGSPLNALGSFSYPNRHDEDDSEDYSSVDVSGLFSVAWGDNEI